MSGQQPDWISTQSQPQQQQQQQPPQQPMSYMIPSLEKARFDEAYKNWCLSRHVFHDRRMMNIDGKLLDLHSLHVQVMNEGPGKVSFFALPFFARAVLIG